VLDALIRLRAWRRLAGRLPLGAVAAQIIEDTGWLALAATSPGGAQAGVLLQAVDCVRAVADEGGGLSEAAAALLEGEGKSSGAEVLPLEPGRRDVVRLMNLHKAKGLEADVVFLADPAHGWEFPVVSRIVREGERAAGYLKISNKYGRKVVVLAHPAGWEAHEAAEQVYHDAEVNRLMYVAATRARDLLVIGRWAAVVKRSGETRNEAWVAFEDYLKQVPELAVEEAPGKAARPAGARSVVIAGGAERAAAEAERAAWHEALRAPSWAVTSPSGEKARVTVKPRAVVDGAREPGSPSARPEVDRADAGAAWGTLLHGLLEHAMRHADASRDDLARLAAWLTVEHEDIRPFISEALDVVDSVRQMPFWHEAHAGAEVHVEVPFAVRVDSAEVGWSPGSSNEWSPGSSDPGSRVPAGALGLQTRGPVVLHGVIDLVYLADGGWRILDYKSDRLDGMMDVDREMLARYGPQIEQYRHAWERVTGGKVTSAGLVALREKRAIIVR
jgi:ATP-dependent helicase/nuclease subunit A